MHTQQFTIEGIPAVVWGPDAPSVFLAVHGNMSNKMDTPIRMLAEQATGKGYQVLSFDLPQHGERSGETEPIMVDRCVDELHQILSYAQTRWQHLSLLANSMGASFSLVAFPQVLFEQVLFLSPVVDMQRLIRGVMQAFQITEDQLETKETIETPIGMTLYWRYYQYVKQHPVDHWDSPTAVLYGQLDEISERESIEQFCSRFSASPEIAEGFPHYFHTPEHLARYALWLEAQLGNAQENDASVRMLIQGL